VAARRYKDLCQAVIAVAAVGTLIVTAIALITQ